MASETTAVLRSGAGDDGGGGGGDAGGGGGGGGNAAITSYDGVARLTADAIVPDLMEAPAACTMRVAFGGIEIGLGGRLSVAAGQQDPVIDVASVTRGIRDSGNGASGGGDGDGDGGSVMLLAFDPDIPSAFGPGLVHLAVLNHGSRENSLVMHPWTRPNPPANTGPHRYVFVALRQRRVLAVSDVSLPKRFTLAGFRESHRSVLAEGPPLNVAYFVAGFDWSAGRNVCLSCVLCSCCVCCCVGRPPADFRAKADGGGPPRCAIM